MLIEVCGKCESSKVFQTKDGIWHCSECEYTWEPAKVAYLLIIHDDIDPELTAVSGWTEAVRRAKLHRKQDPSKLDGLYYVESETAVEIKPFQSLVIE